MLAHPRVSRNITFNTFYAGLMSLKQDWTVWKLFLGHRGMGLAEIGIMIVFPIMGWIAEKSSLSTAFLVLISLALPVLFTLPLRLRVMDLLGDVPAGELVGMSR